MLLLLLLLLLVPYESKTRKGKFKYVFQKHNNARCPGRHGISFSNAIQKRKLNFNSIFPCL